jgi:hypothetical protein
MTQAQQDAMAKFNQLSRQREEFEGHEKKAKRLRKIAVITFLISVFLIILFRMVITSALFSGTQLKAARTKASVVEYLFLFFGAVSFGFLLVSVFKSIKIQIKAENARRQEGILAEKLFSSMLTTVESD